MARELSRTVTYYLGAGASYNALPIVNEMKNGLNKISRNFGKYQAIGDPFAKKMWEDFNWLSDQHTKYYSIDTAANVFFRRGGGSRSTDLHRLKNAVSLYFLLEQLECVSEKMESIKDEPIDNRYFRLLAYFFGDSPSYNLPPNLNFISWNYDIQIELAYHHFTGNDRFSESTNDLNSLPRGGKYNFVKKDIDTGKLVHLNGIAGLSEHHEQNGEVLYSLYDRIERNSIEDIFNSLNKTDFFNKYSSEYMLSFAWEKGLSREYQNRAMEIMKATDDLVIIGYSFPNFNRDTDRTLIKAFLENNRQEKHIYLQDPKEDVKRKFENLFQPKNIPVTQEKDKEEFFIPPYI
ncbi:MAG TPA: hypothetical protein DCG19_04235 [Cryomorphaceae bacterium]|nr:hypothetical protein [Owenweeksia sp.]HAD96590.1 hypothetical protein [Cryomorphaceae bacterium]HBF21688.1 hypothetical protein [Cryomorphaceae bacterium]HCQ15186.1 hypothetical protein [Cryomorphaceae bacterium]|tara:strand:- start:1303 stop:2346 length:1044 start_codon:yes stop_codon:yes gene_type:complete